MIDHLTRKEVTLIKIKILLLKQFYELPYPEAELIDLKYYNSETLMLPT